jgi:hypothetical protein
VSPLPLQPPRSSQVVAEKIDVPAPAHAPSTARTEAPPVRRTRVGAPLVDRALARDGQPPPSRTPAPVLGPAVPPLPPAPPVATPHAGRASPRLAVTVRISDVPPVTRRAPVRPTAPRRTASADPVAAVHPRAAPAHPVVRTELVPQRPPVAPIAAAHEVPRPAPSPPLEVRRPAAPVDAPKLDLELLAERVQGILERQSLHARARRGLR